MDLHYTRRIGGIDFGSYFMKKLSKRDWIKIFLKSLLLQVGFNYERKQGLGWGWIFYSVRNKLVEENEYGRSFFKRHFMNFNTNPYLVGYAIGAVIKCEEQGKTEQSWSLKNSLGNALGAVGDNLIWRNLRPALIILGLVVFCFKGIWGPIIFWLSFNFIQIYLRIRGLSKGYQLQERVFLDFNSKFFKLLSKITPLLGSFLLGVFLIFKGKDSLNLEQMLVFVGILIFSAVSFKKNLSPVLIFLMSLVGGILITTVLMLL